MGKRKTHEEYVGELKIKNPNVEVLGIYINNYTPILHCCKKHNVKWKAFPASILRGCGCNECGKEKIGSSLSKTHKQYVEELHNVNCNIVAVEEYRGANTPILHKCLIDDYEWMARPANILFGNGCPKCANKYSMTPQEYNDKLKEVNPTVVAIDEFINMKTPIVHRCLKHNIQWLVTPSSTLQGCGCWECGKEKIGNLFRRTHEEYVKKLAITNKDIIVIEEYINANTPILHKCLIDGCEWCATPGHILSGCGCPQCCKSKGEKEIESWLNNNEIEYIPQYRFTDCRDNKPLPFDFYLPMYNCCIEYDGGQHYRPIDYFGGQESFEITVKHDNMKNEYCKNNGIPLLRIPYFKNIEEELNNFLFI